MATFLYKLGRLAFRRRRIVALLWVALLVSASVAASTAGDPPEDDFSLPGTEAQQAADLMEERFDGMSADGAEAKIVFRAPNGDKITATEHRETVEKVVEKAGGGQAKSAVSPFQNEQQISQDGSIAYAQITYGVNAMEITDKTRDQLKAAAELGREAGLSVEMGGDALFVEPDMGNGEIIGIGVAAFVLIVTFGSLVAAGLPLITALIGVSVGISSIVGLGPVLGLSANTITLAMMIGLAVGIDYALFIASRYRAELMEGRDREEAAGRAVGTAGSAVVFAGLTVVIALSGLAVVNIPVLTKMGFAAAGTVVIAVLVAITLVPAALGMVGKRIFGRKVRKANPETGVPAPDADAKPPMGARWASFTLRRPVVVLVTAVLALGAVALPVSKLHLGLPDEGNQPTHTTQRKAYDMMAEGFGPGFNGPLVMLLDQKNSDDPQGAGERIAEKVREMDGVAFVGPAVPNKAGDAALVTVVPEARPSSVETQDLVKDLRAKAGEFRADTGTAVLVTGLTAINVDFSQVMDDALVPYLALVVGLAFLLLLMVFRSILVPLKAALGFLLSVLAALGAVVAVFQWGWLAGLLGVEQTGPIMSMMPIFMIGVIFGLAMDYEVFLVTRMREAYVHGESASEAIVTGFKLGARVVTAAAIIMISVFAGFIGAGETMIKMMGFGLAVAILFDAFIVRMAIVPAVLALLGDKAWKLPRWLDRILPNVDVEGEKLAKYLDSQKAVDFRKGDDGDGGPGGGGGGGNGGGTPPTGPAGGQGAATAQPQPTAV
ncbi:MMPL family transporter [Streptomyces alkaliterrae]|uniref:MMPL family transporter n=1 Tax=Streptomyces alkaliterrae TaxID=2213162 RepID=A0A5P0YUB2_9ACTN|nr:MMPL family transporter [Streptomyces alkaliterrae]MBB1254871.1 MMPL family transporter [Streptomyces alkaliterrae]MBB1262023.1 MMPL family transporter [Streptomyces alkaliterrae]MQS03207.1 MMPL family transporter [Streptomyces alkaliterrae]